MLKDIVEVKTMGGRVLYLRFEDGVEGKIDVGALVEFNGVFAPLREPARFEEVYVNPELGTICWPNGADLDPCVLYAKIIGAPLPGEQSLVSEG
ncbi:MAG: DUF2442 domain-containing protein [Gammaproteobacteria bacterium]|nr:DUF2442 domain-containing protein [Gammaproteobacteria bacterium]MBA3731089.1 DUF2442 domain-containing protein [Gammaproteobacteria bacterium]